MDFIKLFSFHWFALVCRLLNAILKLKFLSWQKLIKLQWLFVFDFFLPFLVFYAQNAVSSRLTFLQQPRTRQPLSCNLNYCFKYSLNMTLPLLFAGWWGKLTFQSLWFLLFFFFSLSKKKVSTAYQNKNDHFTASCAVENILDETIRLWHGF